MTETIDAVSYAFSGHSDAGSWRVERVDFEEALNEPFEAIVELAAHAASGDATLLLGQDARIEITRGSFQRTLIGIVSSVDHGMSHDSGGEQLPSARVHIVPALRALESSFDTRLFQDRSVREILDELLTEALGMYDREVAIELEETYPKREICLQYRETTFDFVHRLMEEEGIGYRFTFAGEVELMTLTDRNDSFPVADTAETPVVFSNDQNTLHEGVTPFRIGQQLVSTSTVVRTFDWTTPRVALEKPLRTTDEQGRDREVYDHGRELRAVEQSGADFAPTDQDRQALLRRQLAARDERLGRGNSTVTGLTVGTKFELRGHDEPAFDAEYYVTRVRHRSSGAYVNEFECLPIAVPWRPDRRHRRPEILSVQTATVVGPENEEIHTDEHGRIRVHLHWDRQGFRNETSMCWVRVSQRWSGAGWGFMFLPRIGMEVIVSFIDGCADRPLVTGSLYNGVNTPPYTLPDDKTKSTIKSNSSLGGDGFNELRFEDKAGEEEVFLHAQKDHNEEVLNDHNTHVVNNQTNTVDVDQTQTVHGNQTEQVDGNQTMTVDSARTVHVKGAFNETIDTGETRTVTGGSTETISGGATRTVSGKLTETINGGENRTIHDGQTETINGNLDLTVNGPVTQRVNGPRSRVVQGGISETATGAYELIAPAGTRFVSEGGHTILAQGGQQRVDKEWDFLGGKFWLVFTDVAEVMINTQMAFGFRICTRGIDCRRTVLKVDGVGPLFENVPGVKIELKGLSKWEAGGYAANLAAILFL